MMAKVYKIEDLYKNRKKIRVKEYLKKSINDAANWFNDNKEFALMVAIPVGLTIIKYGGRFVTRGMKLIQLKRAESIKNLYCYDRSLGHYWKLRRELTNNEWLMIDKRKQQGERLADILSELKVLK